MLLCRRLEIDAETRQAAGLVSSLRIMGVKRPDGDRQDLSQIELDKRSHADVPDSPDPELEDFEGPGRDPGVIPEALSLAIVGLHEPLCQEGLVVHLPLKDVAHHPLLCLVALRAEPCSQLEVVVDLEQRTRV